MDDEGGKGAAYGDQIARQPIYQKVKCDSSRGESTALAKEVKRCFPLCIICVIHDWLDIVRIDRGPKAVDSAAAFAPVRSNGYESHHEQSQSSIPPSLRTMIEPIPFQELVGGTSKKQNWKGLSIAFLVIAIVWLFIAAAILITNTHQVPVYDKLLPITEQDVFNVKVPEPWNGTWISNSRFSYPDGNDSIWIYNCETFENELLFKSDFIQHESIGRAVVSPTAKYVLIPMKKGKTSAYYTEYLYDLYDKSKFIASVALPENRRIPLAAIQYSQSDNLFAFIYNFDIYVYNVSKKTSYRATSDGNRSAIHNGLVEWSYEYELYNQNPLLFWSPTDRYLAFIKINLTGVPRNYYLKYDLTLGNDDLYSIPYPKHNDPIPTFDAYIFNTRTKKVIRIPRPLEYEKLKTTDVYIYHIVWSCNTCFAVVYANRQRNVSFIQLYEIAYDKISYRAKFVEETRHGSSPPRFLKPYFSSNGSYAYLVRFDPPSGGKPRVVRIHLNQSYPQADAKSPAEIDADEILHVDKLGRVYFTGSEQSNTLEKQLFRWTHTNSVPEFECLSCNESCGYSTAQFSRGNGSYYVLQCFGPSIPYSVLYKETEKLALLNDNEPFRQWINDRLLPSIDYFSVPLNDKGTVIGNGMIILPPNYNPNRTIASYPVIVSINDRLHHQRVTKKFILPLAEYLQVMEENLTIVMFDARRDVGQDWLEQQSQDYIKLAQHLKMHEAKYNETLNGTRFGLVARGPAAAVALKLLQVNEKDKDEYICAFLQSPVYDLSHYHATFTDQIAGLQPDWIRSPRSHRLPLANKSLAFAHGTADETVHFKHSAALSKALTDAHAPFNFKVYPDTGHAFDEEATIHHDFLRYRRQFFQECLGSRTNKERKIINPEDYD